MSRIKITTLRLYLGCLKSHTKKRHVIATFAAVWGGVCKKICSAKNLFAEHDF